ncbi:hypothetical protein [Parendozoicomonas sp. Alg238-R29]|nr:hypothetical protein [Parendozoicomonas sp. Alg238-R29]
MLSLLLEQALKMNTHAHSGLTTLKAYASETTNTSVEPKAPDNVSR